MQGLLKIGQIVRPHGVKGAVKVLCFVEENFSVFKHVFVTDKRVSAQVTKVQALNNDAYSVTFDVIKDIDMAERFRNEFIYIDRTEYPQFKEKIYFSDLINKPVVNENGEVLGKMVDYDDYGAGVVLTIKCGVVSYSLPYVEEFITYNIAKEMFEIEQQKFEDLRVWE